MNIQRGCEHDCRYCYARYNAVDRFKRCEAQHWRFPCIDEAKVDRPHKKKYPGRVMFPTTHDITNANISQYMCVLRKLLDAGNDVLIVSKPRWSCITILCETLTEYKEQITFRFTIGSAKNEILKFWEPNAPNLTERLSCLHYAFLKGYKTSVSCEPMLDGWPQHVYLACEEWVTDKIWFGKLRNIISRVDVDKTSMEEMFDYVQPVIDAQKDSMIFRYVEQMKNWPKVEWKDSIKEVIERAK